MSSFPISQDTNNTKSEDLSVNGMPIRSDQDTNLVVVDHDKRKDVVLNIRNKYTGMIRPELLTNELIITAHDILPPMPTAVTIPDHVSETETMKAVVFRGALNAQYVDVPKPVVTDIKDAIVKILHTDICGSNVSSLAVPNGYPEAGYSVLGHSFYGVIESLGEGVSNMKVGDGVVGSFQLCCSQCRECDKEHYSNCLNTNNSALNFKVNGARTSAEIGSSKMNGDKWGSFAQYIRMPYAADNLHLVPEGVDIKNASLFSCNTTTSFQAVKIAEPKADDIVIVMGQGVIGALICQYLIEIYGVKKIVVVDTVQYRLDMTKEKYPQVEIINLTDVGAPNMVDKLMELSPIGYTLSFDCTAFRYPSSVSTSVDLALNKYTDSSDTLNTCILISQPNARIIQVAEQRGNMNNVLTGPFFAKALTLISQGQATTQVHIQELMKMVVDNPKLSPEWLITHRISLEETPEYMLKHFNKTDNVQKVMIDL